MDLAFRFAMAMWWMVPPCIRSLAWRLASEVARWKCVVPIVGSLPQLLFLQRTRNRVLARRTEHPFRLSQLQGSGLACADAGLRISFMSFQVRTMIAMLTPSHVAARAIITETFTTAAILMY